MPPRRRTFLSTLLTSSVSLILVVLAGGFAAAALVRLSPGFDVDENSWNPKIGASTLSAMHAARSRESSLPAFYLRYLRAALHGNLGESDSMKAPISELLRERAAVSARIMGFGTAGGLLLGGLCAWLAVWPRRAPLELAAVSTSGLLLAIPPAVLALGFFFFEAPLWLAAALALLPRVFGSLRALFTDAWHSPSLLAARARGIRPAGLALRYVIGPALPQLLALAGVALVLTFGALIPIEALCDVPGIGQLAWKAALARDLPLLSGLALIVTFTVALVHFVGEFVR